MGTFPMGDGRLHRAHIIASGTLRSMCQHRFANSRTAAENLTALSSRVLQRCEWYPVAEIVIPALANEHLFTGGRLIAAPILHYATAPLRRRSTGGCRQWSGRSTFQLIRR